MLEKQLKADQADATRNQQESFEESQLLSDEELEGCTGGIISKSSNEEQMRNLDLSAGKITNIDGKFSFDK